MTETDEKKVEWRWCPDFEGSYEVSDAGEVRSVNYLHTGKKKVLKPGVRKNGYLYVNLCKNGVVKKYTIHRLVALAFIPNPLNLPQVNHLNEDKTDNRSENLEWCDSKYNSNFGTRIKRIAEKNTNGKKSKSIVQLTKEGDFVRKWPSMREIQRELKFYIGAISQCCTGKYKSSYGFKWLFEEDYIKLK